MLEDLPPACRWDSRKEETLFAKFEEQFNNDLRCQTSFVEVALDFANRLGKYVRLLPSGYSLDFLVDLICSANCLCLRAWRDYVKANQRVADPETLVKILGRLPRLADYLASVNLDSNIVKKFPTLAKEDLVSRNAYADGGRLEDYIEKYGTKIQPPDPRLVIVPTVETEAFRDFFGSSFIDNETVLNVNKRFHLLQSFSIGRQKSGEPSQFDVIYGEKDHRMVIAGKMESSVASRDQIELIVLTPDVLYVKNTGSLFPIVINPVCGESRILDIGKSCTTNSDVRIQCNNIQIDIISVQSERNR